MQREPRVVGLADGGQAYLADEVCERFPVKILTISMCMRKV
jgi:hypothetical protein